MYSKLLFKDFQAKFEKFDNWDLSHKHEAYEIFLLTEGEKMIQAVNRQYDMKPGYVFLVTPEVPHKYIGDKPYARYEITFTRRFMETFFSKGMIKRLLRCFTSEVMRLNESEVESFKRIFDELIKARDEGDDYPIQFARILCLLGKASERVQSADVKPQENTKEVAALVNVVAYINSHYREIRSMDEITQACFISKSYLCCVFKEAYGMTVMEYLRKVRVRYACDFLATTDKNLSLIAQKMGFVDLSHFTKVFKKETGMSPNEYRAQKKKERENLDV